MCRNAAYENACQLEKICYNSKCKADKYQNGTLNRVSPRPCSTPKIVLHLPPPRVNSDNVINNYVYSSELYIIAAYSFLLEMPTGVKYDDKYFKKTIEP